MGTNFWLTTISGFLNGFNPCTLAVMLFFIAFLFSMAKNRTIIFQFGLVYISAVFLTYFLIGLGIFKGMVLWNLNANGLLLKISAVLILLLGLISLKEAFLPKLKPSLRMAHLTKKPILAWMKKVASRAGLAATFLLGVIIALFSFSCSGGIYLTILALLSSQIHYLNGVFYLLWYNLMFILPLLILLFLTSNRLVTEKLILGQEKNDFKLRFWLGIFMLGLGILVLNLK